MDLLLINVGGMQKKVYQGLNEDYSAIETPFWAALMAGFFRNKGYDVDILDANAENLDLQETVEAIESKNPELVNIVVFGQQPSASTQLMPGVRMLCNELKKKNPNRKISLTGPHPSSLPEKTLKEEACDFVCEGEGFYTLLGLIEKKALNEIPGLWYYEENSKYNSDNDIKHNNPAQTIKNLDEELPEVAWDLLPMDKYKAHNWHCLDDLESRKSYASIYTALGCPFNCNFCCINAPFGKPSYRAWSPEWVIRQIDILVTKYNVKNLKFIDELFILKPEHFLKIADYIIEKGYKINIWAYARIDTINEDHLSKLKKAGINWLALGIESGDEAIRLKAQKGTFKGHDIKEIVKKIKAHDINVGGNYIFGLPEDTIESMQKTLDLAIELNCEWTNFYCAMAYPGSKLHDDTEIEFLPESSEGPGWIGYSQHSYETFPLSTKILSAKEILEFRDKAFNSYFTNPRYLNIIEEKFGKNARTHLEEMTKIKLKRKILEDSKIDENYESEENKELLSSEKCLEIFKKMSTIREFEKQVMVAYDDGKINCPIYLSIGQEAISSTVSSFFKSDLIFAQHRAHSVYLAFGGDKNKIVDELLGKDSGCNQGKGGSPGVGDINIGMMGHHGLSGENVPLAVGAALGDQSKKVVCFIGDAAAEEDYVFSAMAFASTHKLPVLFICEDNDLSILTKKKDRRNWELNDPLKSIGMNAVDIPDDPKLIAHYIEKFKDDLPAFINCRTCRHRWHVGTGEDGEPSIDRLKLFKEEILEKGIDKDIIIDIENETKSEMGDLWKKLLQKQ